MYIRWNILHFACTYLLSTHFHFAVFLISPADCHVHWSILRFNNSSINLLVTHTCSHSQDSEGAFHKQYKRRILGLPLRHRSRFLPFLLDMFCCIILNTFSIKIKNAEALKRSVSYLLCNLRLSHAGSEASHGRSNFLWSSCSEPEHDLRGGCAPSWRKVIITVPH